MKQPVIAILLLFITSCSSSRMTIFQATPDTSIVFQLPLKWTETLSPTIPITLTPTDAPIPTKTFERLSNGMSAHVPSLYELSNVDSIWSLTRYRELMAPGSMSYSIKVPKNSMWQWDWYFCAGEKYYSDYFGSLELTFLLDDQPLQEEHNLLIYDKPGIKGWICHYWTTVLSRWPPNRVVHLEIRYTFTTDVDDGKTEYPAGDYSQLILAIGNG